MALVKFRASPLPLAPTEYSKQYQDQFIQILSQYFARLDSKTPIEADYFEGGGFRLTKPYAQLDVDSPINFVDTTDANIVQFDDSMSGEFLVDTNTYITVLHDGVYKISVDCELENVGANPVSVQLSLLHHNGSAWPFSDTINSGFVSAVHNARLVKLEKGNTLHLAAFVDAIGVQLNTINVIIEFISFK